LIGTFANGVVIGRKANGESRIKFLHLIAHRTRDTIGDPEYIGAVLDVTQRRLAEQALSQARSELAHVARITSLGVLTASIAHEVNQPLSGIVTNASTCLRMLAADPPNVEGARQTALRTIRDGNRAADVIARLRALFGKRAAAIEPVDLNDAAREVIALLSSDLQRSQVIVRTEFAEGLPLAGGDRIQLQQVIMNLMRNAADAMSGLGEQPRQLVIGTDKGHGDNVCLTVRDAGVGFEPHVTERMFEAFYTTKGDGTGIGLSISRSIIENHKGRLWATPNEEAGATFSFFVPAYAGDDASATPAPAELGAEA
jgi:C4-dicarboxylate-specific signal transduction histidine kinase